MAQTAHPFARLMSLGLDSLTLSVQIGETLVASQAVITARLTMMAAGMNGSARMPFAEMNRMIPEKTKAFGKAQSDATRAFSGTTALVPQLGGAIAQDGLAMLNWWERSAAAAAAWWLPVHDQATANARRLAKSR